MLSATSMHMAPRRGPRADSDMVVHDLLAVWIRDAGSGAVAETKVALLVWATFEPAASTLRRLGDLALRFAARLDATGVGSLLNATADDCDGFVWAPTRRNRPPSMHTVHLRRTALRGLYRAVRLLDPTVTDPTVTLALPSKGEQRARPVTTGELVLIRTAALGRPRQPLRAAVVIALAETGATTGEIPQLTWNDIDLDTGDVALPGAPPVQPRSGVLTDWGAGVLQRWATSHPNPSGLIVTRRNAGSLGHTAQAGIVNSIGQTITAAGITDPQVRPGSIRLWAARQRLDQAGIEAAARLLGVDSLDAAATALDHQWKQA
jgi:integrase/recombinase XerC